MRALLTETLGRTSGAVNGCQKSVETTVHLEAHVAHTTPANPLQALLRGS
jgi:hypothetical protein